jgi:hypothetical protein
MTGFTVLGAGKETIHASTTISAGKSQPRKRNGKRFWYAQWREDGRLRSKELWLCSEMTKGEAEAILAEILRPINENAGGRALPQAFTFETLSDPYSWRCGGANGRLRPR